MNRETTMSSIRLVLTWDDESGGMPATTTTLEGIAEITDDDTATAVELLMTFFPILVTADIHEVHAAVDSFLLHFAEAGNEIHSIYPRVFIPVDGSDDILSGFAVHVQAPDTPLDVRNFGSIMIEDEILR